MKAYKELGHITLGTTLRQLADIVTQDADNIYTQFGFDIDPKWFPVFYVLASKEADSVVNIAKEIKQSHVSVSKIIKEMKNKDLIESYKSLTDSRVTLIKLNSKATAMIPAMEKQCEAVDIAMKQLVKESGVNLWENLITTQQQLTEYKLSQRTNPNYNPEDVLVVDYNSIYQESFKTLNVEWISQYWKLEDPDLKALNNPQSYILNKGGVILIALHNNLPVGCCALIKMNEDTYELAKMAVSPKLKGKRIGYLLGQKIIDRAKLLGAKRLFLESNSVLKPAVNLYTKLGFKHIAESSSPYERCNVQMELFLKD